MPLYDSPIYKAAGPFHVFCITESPGVLKLVFASTTVLFCYQIVLFDIFINCESSSRQFMPMLAGEKSNYYSARGWKEVENPWPRLIWQCLLLTIFGHRLRFHSATFWKTQPYVGCTFYSYWLQFVVSLSQCGVIPTRNKPSSVRAVTRGGTRVLLLSKYEWASSVIWMLNGILPVSLLSR
jgi:uncharacterized protein YceK